MIDPTPRERADSLATITMPVFGTWIVRIDGQLVLQTKDQAKANAIVRAFRGMLVRVFTEFESGFEQRVSRDVWNRLQQERDA